MGSSVGSEEDELTGAFPEEQVDFVVPPEIERWLIRPDRD